MSSEVMALVLRAEIGNAAKKAVLVGLAEHAGPDGRNAYPSVERLAIYADLGESTVREKLAQLREEGLVFIIEDATHHKPTNYGIDLKRLRELEHPKIQELAARWPRPPISGGEETSSSRRSKDGRPPAPGGLDKGDLQLPEGRPPAPGKETSSSQQGDLQLPEANRPINPQVNRPINREVVPPPISPPHDGDDAVPDARFAELIKTWEKAAGPLTPIMAENLRDLCDEAEAHRTGLPAGSAGHAADGCQWVIEAIREASRSSTRGAISVKFVDVILQRWMREGFKTPYRRASSSMSVVDEWLAEVEHGD